MNHLELWKKAKERLKAAQPQHAYSTWFDPIKSIGFSQEELVLEVPNQFFFEWIQTHYKDIIVFIKSNKAFLCRSDST